MARELRDGRDEIAYTTLDGEEASLRRTELEGLRAGVATLITRNDAEYDDARGIWNAMVDRRPALIARCASARDVRNAVLFARDHGMLLSVRGGGHHIAGNAVADGSLTIDLAPLRRVHVEVEQRTARIGGGALLGDVDRATQAVGLALPLGINSTTGFSGLCLGGGFGWLTRKYGMTIDNLRGAEIVTADGEIRTVSASLEPDLFWAIRGGGGNFGVVTSFDVQLHRVGPIVHSGLVVYPAAQAREVMRAWRDLAEDAPDELTTWVVMRKAPPLPFLPAEVHGTDVVVIIAVYSGNADDGARATEPLTKLGTPVGTMLAAQPYAAMQQAFDPLLAPGARNYWKTHDFETLGDDALDVIIAAARAIPSPECELFVAQLGGAMARVPREATAYAGRNARYVMNVHGRWRSPSDDDLVRRWARRSFELATPYATGGGYVNFLTSDESSRVAAAYGANYERLTRLKRRYDPMNQFRMNLNIPPADPAARRIPATNRNPPLPPR